MPRKVNRKKKEKVIPSKYNYEDDNDDCVFIPSPPPSQNSIIEIFKKNPYLIVFTILAIDKIVTYIKPYFNANNT